MTDRDAAPSTPDVARMRVRMLEPGERMPADRRYSPTAWPDETGTLRRYVIDEWEIEAPIPCAAAWEAHELARKLNGKAPAPAVDPEMAAMLAGVGR